ncbi:AAA family ATPase [Candidatus Poribacteria bacterium]|nr:AAA family ATPase [Candidatus Poribacteria bacterium]
MFQIIGRRKEIRRIKEDFFTRGIRVVVLHGIGGIGKTVTASKIAEKLEKHFNGIYTFKCSKGTTIEEVLINLNIFFKGIGINQLDQVCNAPIPIETKLNYLAQVLSQIKLLLIFDNFEELLLEEKDRWEIRDANFKNGLKILINQCKDGTRFLFTSRYTFNLTLGINNKNRG